MKNTEKAIIVVVVLLFCIVVGELIYYFSLKPSSSQKTAASPLPTQSLGTKDAVSAVISEEDLITFKNDPQAIFRGFFKEEETYLQWRNQMGVDIDSWIALSTYDKDCLDSLILFRRLKGTVTDKSDQEEDFVRFKLKSPTGTTMTIYENEEGIKSAKVFKEVDGVRNPSTLNDMKDGDSIIIEAEIDMRKPADDPQHYVSKKYIIKSK